MDAKIRSQKLPHFMGNKSATALWGDCFTFELVPVVGDLFCAIAGWLRLNFVTSSSLYLFWEKWFVMLRYCF